MKVALTGATGFIGSRILTELHEHGHGLNPTVAELTQAAAVAAGTPGAVPGSDDEARAELGWSRSHPSLVDEFRRGSYRK